MPDLQEIITSLEKREPLDFKLSFSYAQHCSSLIKDGDSDANNIAINVLNNWQYIDVETKPIWADIIETLGFYPYLNMSHISEHFRNLPGKLRNGRHYSAELQGKYFHEGQLELLSILKGDKNLIVSAPTSFGKSLLIEEIIASKRCSNIVIIQPTLALLDETRRKLLKYSESYKLIVRTSQEPSVEKGNIFLFTAERVNEYPEFPKIDFLVIDEFYKLSGNRDDERSASLNNAFHFILKSFNPRFYLLGPNIDGISEGFTEKYNAEFYKTDFSLVGSKQVNIYENHIGEFGNRGKKKQVKENRLFELLYELKEEQTIIYCSSPNRVRYLAKEFSNYLNEQNYPKAISEEIPLIEWINNNIDVGWSLKDFLLNNIGIHDGALQKHITTTVIDSFNQGELSWLFCTSTIIEGVNTSAKNIVYYDEMKGPNAVDFFDYSNIKGRAGRMMEHYIGTIYNFNPPPSNESIIIDIPFFEQNPIKDEVLIQLEQHEVKNQDSEQYLRITNIPKEEREVIKSNGVKVHGQKSIIDILRHDISSKYDLIAWSGTPKYPQLTYLITLAHENLLIEGETKMSIKRLTNRTFNYGINQNIKQLVTDNFDFAKKMNPNKDEIELMDDAIRETFQLMKHWFQYKIPKWLSVINELQKFVCEERGLRPGNYTYYSNLIENDFLRDNLAILSEYGIPNSAIRKLERFIPKELNQDEVLNYIKRNKLAEKATLIQYEAIKINQNL